MNLVINTEGTYLSKNGECFCIKNGENKSMISAKKVESILITVSVSLSSDVIRLAVENNIDIVFTKRGGEPFARAWHCNIGKISTIRRKQLFLSDNILGKQLISEFLLQKLNSQKEHLEILKSNRRDKRGDSIKESIDLIDDKIIKITNLCNDESYKSINDIRLKLQGFEGNASKAYFKALSISIPEKYKFNGRSRNPAKNYFNCMLNYGYGVLYSRVEDACIIAGLDPHVGIMHTDAYNRKVFVFDLIEMYRVYIDKVVFKLFSTKKIKDDFFDKVSDGYYLNKKGKIILIEAIEEFFATKIRYKNKNIAINKIFAFDCHNISNRILDSNIEFNKEGVYDAYMGSI